MRFSPAVAVTITMLVAVMGAGIAAILAARRWLKPSSGNHAGSRGIVGNLGQVGQAGPFDQGGWENTIAVYRNLRDEGVLSEEEFRKIRTLVEPRPRTGTPELRARHWPSKDPAGPAQARE
jgi:hypothetical protein